MLTNRELKPLVYVSDSDPGIMRKRNGKGFVYVDPHNKKIQQRKTLQRIQSLVIPPMWDHVWISPVDNGYLQSTGVDAKKRKQYIYHPAWVARQQQNKFEKLLAFGQALGSLRKKIAHDLKLRGWPKVKVTALTVDMLDNYLLRVGNEQYVKQNHSYGLTTLRMKHLHDHGNSLTLSFKAKSGIHRIVKIEDKKTARLIREISELPGHEIFRYLDENGESHKLDSSDVNNYIKEICNDNFTAKDFRTWGGSRLILEELPRALQAIEVNPKQKLETQLVKRVATMLGNTVSVCRSYYVHPKLLEYACQTDLISYTRDLKAAEKTRKWARLNKYEKLILKILSKQ
jgi:DNA topoisomerase-1